MHLLVSRPQPDAERTAAALRARGHDVLLAPLLMVEAIADADLGPAPGACSGVIITSANAVRALAGHPRAAALLPLPLFAVGRRSAAAAGAAGFTEIAAADGDARDLVRLIAARCAGARAPLLYLAGAERAVDVAAALAEQAVPVRTAVVYRTVKAAAFPPPIIAALLGTVRGLNARGPNAVLDGVLHFSPRTAEAYLDCAAAADLLTAALTPVHYCLSPQVAQPLVAIGATRIRTAPHPDETALIDTVGSPSC